MRTVTRGEDCDKRGWLWQGEDCDKKGGLWQGEACDKRGGLWQQASWNLQRHMKYNVCISAPWNALCPVSWSIAGCQMTALWFGIFSSHAIFYNKPYCRISKLLRHLPELRTAPMSSHTWELLENKDHHLFGVLKFLKTVIICRKDRKSYWVKNKKLVKNLSMLWLQSY